MIIFGTTGITSTKAKGNFICPQCANNRLYKHRKVTRFFTLYFIPLIPLGSAGEYVECQTCKGTFVPRVLDNDPEKENKKIQAIYEEAMRHTMISIMLADGEIDENEMETVQSIINKFGHNDVSMEELQALVIKVDAEQLPATHYLSQVAPYLNEHSKEVIIRCAIAVAGADSVFATAEIDMIMEMAKAMEMSKSHLKGILDEILVGKYTFSQN